MPNYQCCIKYFQKIFQLQIKNYIFKMYFNYLCQLLWTRGLNRARNGPERTGTPFRFVKCIGISVPFRRDWLYELNIHFSFECYNILTSLPFREIFHFEHCIWNILNCHSHSNNTKPKNMLMFILCIKRIFIDWLTGWLAMTPECILYFNYFR